MLIDGKPCKVTFSTLELIRCNTSAYGNESCTGKWEFQEEQERHILKPKSQAL